MNVRSLGIAEFKILTLAWDCVLFFFTHLRCNVDLSASIVHLKGHTDGVDEYAYYHGAEYWGLENLF